MATATPDLSLVDAPPQPSSKMWPKLLAMGFMLVVVATECLLASMYLSAGNEVSTSAPEPPAGESLPKTEAAVLLAEEETEEEAPRAEVDLYEYSVTSFQSASNTTLHIDFHLFGTVHPDDKLEFESLRDENQHRFRGAVITIIRSAELQDLTDPGLGLIKRKILTTTNRMFGKMLLKEVIFSDFSFYEQ